MYDTIAATWPRDPDLPKRAWQLTVLRALLNGTFYDHLQHEFHEEADNSNKFIPIAQRRPSMRYALPYLIVRESVGFLFSEGHFPQVVVEEDEAAQEWLRNVVVDSRLNEVMLDAAQRGSVGSVCLQVRLLKKRLFFDVLETEYLTPTWQPDAPDTLDEVEELRKVEGEELQNTGYSVEKGKRYWFRRVWDATGEWWFKPIETGSEDFEKGRWSRDETRSVAHNLGFVPMVWIKNLQGGDNIDGACTFWHARHNAVEVDYMLSHCRRGLRWSSDPLLALRDPSYDVNGMPTGGGNVLALGDNGDAKYLEISGGAAEAVLSYVKGTRELSLEVVGGNRAPADRIASAQSGRALELMNHGLIVLADQLRATYGEGGLRSLLHMCLEIRRRQPIEVRRVGVPEPAQTAHVSLRWPPWYAPMPDDELTRAQALSTSVSAGILSREDATRIVAPGYDIEDIDAAISRAAADRAEAAEATAAAAAQQPPQ